MRLLIQTISVIGFLILGILFFWTCKKRRKKDLEKFPVLTEWDLKCMAYHEAGHAVCSHFLPEREKLLKITINPSEESFGMIKTECRLHHNETEVSLMSAIATFLAGRIAEEKFLNAKTSSCIYDLKQAGDIALDMVGKFGMGKRMKKFSAISVYDNSCSLYSEEFRKRMDEDIMNILEAADSMASETISTHSETVVRLAQILMKKKTLSDTEINSFFYGERNAIPFTKKPSKTESTNTGVL